jgi:hypothetical protein
MTNPSDEASAERIQTNASTLAQNLEIAKGMLKRGNAAAVRQILTEALREKATAQEARLLLAQAYEQVGDYGKARSVLRLRSNDGAEDQELHDFEERLQDIIEAKKNGLPKVWGLLLALVVLVFGGLLIANGLPFDIPIELTILLEKMASAANIDQLQLKAYATHSLAMGSILSLISIYLLLRFPLRRFAYRRLVSRAYREWPDGAKRHDCPACGLTGSKKKKCVHCGHVEPPVRTVPLETGDRLGHSVQPPVGFADGEGTDSREESTSVTKELHAVEFKSENASVEYAGEAEAENDDIPIPVDTHMNLSNSENVIPHDKRVAIGQLSSRGINDNDQLDVNEQEGSSEKAIWWWVDKSGKRHGPCTASELTSAASKGDFNLQTMVWRKGDEWRRAKDVSSLEDLIQVSVIKAHNGAKAKFSPRPMAARTLPIIGFVAGVVILIFLIGYIFPFVGSPSAHEMSLDNSADILTIREQVVEDFMPLSEAKEMTWVEYREYSAGMLDWMEYRAIPSAIKLSKQRAKEQVDEILATLEKMEKVSRSFLIVVQGPEYGGESQHAANFRNFLRIQKITKDRMALHAARGLVRFIQPKSSTADPYWIMFVNQMTDEYLWSTNVAIMSARNFERDQQHAWGIEESNE